MLTKLAAASLLLLGTVFAQAETISFDQHGPVGAVPTGFAITTTGKGKSADWRLQAVEGAPSGTMAVAQLSTEGASSRFPLLIHTATKAANVVLSVKFKAVSGKEDQAAGLVWRYRDANNYYIVRANALEDNVVLYIVKDGRRIDLPVKGQGRTYGAKAPVDKVGWNTLGVEAQGTLFTVSLNGQRLYEVEDKTFAGPGHVGLWTKADSVMLFDDLVIEPAR